MTLFDCPYLGAKVELSQAREDHIAQRHPELIPARRQIIADTLLNPDTVRISVQMGTARLLCRWYADLLGGKYVVVVVAGKATARERPRIVTAYIARRLGEGRIEWKRS